MTQPALRRPVGALIFGVLVVGAAMLATSGIVHLYLFLSSKYDYRSVKTVGPMFLMQGIVGCLLAIAVVVVRRPLLALAGAVFMGASIAGLYLSIHGGLFGYGETWGAPYVKLAFFVELVGLAALVVALVMLVLTSRSAVQSDG